jgi:hypothetical protein
MIFSKKIIANSRMGADQFSEVRRARNMANNHNMAIMRMAASAANDGSIVANEGLIPRDVYLDFDNVTVEIFQSDNGDTFLNDLMPLSRSVSIGKLVSKFRQASDAGRAQTSMSGQIGIKMDQVEYKYDGTIVPIHDTGYSRNWREWAAMNSEGFDGLIDDQRESVRSLRIKAADSFLDGHKDKSGNIIVVDGTSWEGMRNDSRVNAIDIGAAGINFDFTDNTKTGDQIKAAFIQVRDVMWITNNCERDMTVYVSREIASNFERKFSAQYDAKIIMQELAELMGIAAIKTSSKLSGNEFMGFPLDSQVIAPVVGMGINTVAMPRPVYNSNYEFAVWGAIGYQVKTDFDGRSCAFFAQELS